MFRASRAALVGLRPRNVNETPPVLSKRYGEFVCKVCSHRWKSNNVFVTKTTKKVYQGETCLQCGTTNRPKFTANRFDNSKKDQPGRFGGHSTGHMKLRKNGLRI